MTGEMVALGFGMASTFGLIVGVFSVWNGRMTRREIVNVIRETQLRTEQLIRETQQLIRETQLGTERLIRETQQQTHQLIREEQAANREMLMRLHENTARILAKLG